VAEFPFNSPATKVKIIPLNTSALFQMSCASTVHHELECSNPYGNKHLQMALKHQIELLRIANFEGE
jgi:hypothetical protein